MHLAAQFTSALVVKAIFEASAGSVDVDVRDSEQQTPLHWAAHHNWDADVVQFLLSNGANVRAIDKLQETPLHKAASNHFAVLYRTFSRMLYILSYCVL